MTHAALRRSALKQRTINEMSNKLINRSSGVDFDEGELKSIKLGHI